MVNKMEVMIDVYGKTEIKLCDHISIFGRKHSLGYENCEYIEEMTIKCSICNEEHLVMIAVN